MTQCRIITLTEYEPHYLTRDELSEAVAETLWREFHAQIQVDPPSFQTQNRWRLTVQGWVGFISVSPTVGFSLRPRVPLRNIFGMLDIAHSLRSLQFGRDLFEATTLEEFYELLALILARQVLARGRSGIYRAYIDRVDRLPYMRGAINVPQMVRTPIQADVVCRYAEQTTDVEENQLLAWALYLILQSSLCRESILPTIRRAYRTIRNVADAQPYPPSAYRNRTYNRLNRDYHRLHALSHFFVEHSGPSYESGDREMLPFMVNMPRLYERFVAEWLMQNLDERFQLRAQEQFVVGHRGASRSGISFAIDLVIYDQVEQSVRWVLDTKYKTPQRGPESADIQQVLAYAHARQAPEAILIYPVELAQPLDAVINGIRVRTLSFGTDGELNVAGRKFLEQLVM